MFVFNHFFEGFNTGVVLFDLERMRRSAEYNKFLEAEEVTRLMSKYGYHVSLGDQDWFSNIGFEVNSINEKIMTLEN